MIAVLTLGLALASAGADGGAAAAPGAPPDSAAAHPAPVEAAADTSVRVPGCPLRLGWRHERTGSLGSFRSTGSGPGTESREGPVTWFGYPAKASLTYRGGRLAGVKLTSDSPSPRLAGYVPDELRRLGYRRVSAERTGTTTTSVWAGPARIRLVAGPRLLTAEVTPDAPRAPGPADRAAAPAATSRGSVPALAAPAAPLDLTTAAADSLPAPRRAGVPPDPVRPRIAVEAGVFGRVTVRATVGPDGTVRHAEIERGIPELNNAALEWAGALRYEPYLREGKAVPFVVLIPVAFLPARPSAGGEAP